MDAKYSYFENYYSCYEKMLASCRIGCADVIATTDVAEAFRDLDAAFLVGAMPRKEGMERKDLLAANVKIFKAQGEALKQYSKPDVKVGVFSNRR